MNRRKALTHIGKSSLWVTPLVSSISLPVHAQTSCQLMPLPRSCAAMRLFHNIPELNANRYFIDFYVILYLEKDNCELTAAFFDYDIIVFDKSIILSKENEYSLSFNEDRYSIKLSGLIIQEDTTKFFTSASLEFIDNFSFEKITVPIEAELSCFNNLP